MSREKILEKIKRHQPAPEPLPVVDIPAHQGDIIAAFTTTLVRIGGSVVEVKSKSQINEYLQRTFGSGGRCLSLVDGVGDGNNSVGEAHTLENVVLAVLAGEFGVAENGAVWITNASMGDRALPFITQHLALVINRKDVVPNLHHAYERIGKAPYQYGTFIAGPSKTADIEQSLVLGAHGPKSHVVFLLED